MPDIGGRLLYTLKNTNAMRRSLRTICVVALIIVHDFKPKNLGVLKAPLGHRASSNSISHGLTVEVKDGVNETS